MNPEIPPSLDDPRSLLAARLFPLIELIAALEAAEGPSQTLDCAIESWAVKMPVCIGEFGPQPFTSSIDTALKLVPEVWLWKLTNCTVPTHGGKYMAVVWKLVSETQARPIISVMGATPAIALCIAALKARAEMEKNK